MGPHGTEIGFPSKSPQGKKVKKRNHHFSLKESTKLHSVPLEKHPKAEVDNQEARKAAAWAVFQHHGGGGINQCPAHGSAVRRPSRFKIEAQMKNELAHRSVAQSVAANWDAGSTLFDSFELDSLLRTLDQAANPAGLSQQRRADDGPNESGALVVYSQKSWLSHPQLQPHRQEIVHAQRSLPSVRDVDAVGRLDTVDEKRPLKPSKSLLPGPNVVSYKLPGSAKPDNSRKSGHGHDHTEDDPFASFVHTPSPFNARQSARRSFDSSGQVKPAKRDPHDHHRSKWKNLLHTLHLDGANNLFNRFQGFHAQVAPHDSHKKLDQKAGKSRAKPDHNDVSHGHKHNDHDHSHKLFGKEQDDHRFPAKHLLVSKDVHPTAPSGHEEHRRSTDHSHFWKFGLKSVLSKPFSRQASMSSEHEETATEEARKSDVDRTLKYKHHQHNHQDGHEHGHRRHGKGKNHSGELSGALPEPATRHRHHHHVLPEDEDYELTLPAITRRASRSSFDEQGRRFSMEDGGLKAPRNSLDPSNTYEEQRSRTQLTPWEAESGLRRGSYVQ
ncbi:uncharacterized protein [Physcomitrium patens]|uniref:Uncharacterized protein n=1 Tax=Physcomitrium patens TaxID=3218 RepID=A0A2K1KEF0_PHYPA|nr:uncharacterized protein LOC112283356 [Physcomitrium patens]PNR52153.1 hypothetical protein PHYPA_008527 [Physcomitrium patens]|eukprot:XP_024377714.1 uncharacterized protein LOC112283356 [Physcomitrella patens]